MPAGGEAGDRGRLDGSTLPCERARPRRAGSAQHVGFAPLVRRCRRGGGSPRTSRPVDLERVSSLADALGQPVARRGVLVVNGPRRRASGASEAREGVARPVGERGGDAARRHRRRRVAEAAGVLDGDQPLLAGDAHMQRPALGDEPLGRTPRRRRDRRARRAQVAGPAQQVVDAVRAVARAGGRSRSTSASASGSSSSRSSSVPSSSRSRSRSSASACARRSASGASPSYMYARDVVEQQRLANGDAVAVSTVDQRDLARAAIVAQHVAQRGQVEHVLQALAVRLEHDRERAVAARPPGAGWRLAAAAATAACAGRAGAAGAAARAPRSRGTGARTATSRAQLVDDEVLDLVGIEQRAARSRAAVVGVGQAQHDPVVAPQRLRVDAEPPRSSRSSASAHGACTRRRTA